ncbi:MAG: DUF881 domain-containing protein [Micromonosporaceae bacterium]
MPHDDPPPRPGPSPREGGKKGARDGTARQEPHETPPAEVEPSDTEPRDSAEQPARDPRRSARAGVLIGLLVGLLGFGLAVQLRSSQTDPALATARQEDLVRILDDLDARKERLRDEVASLEDRKRQLNSGAKGRAAALEEARRRADELGILAGTLAAEGPGLRIRFSGEDPLRADKLLNAVEELRGAGAEAMQIGGSDGTAVRIVASTYFLDDGSALDVDGQSLSGPYTLRVIGDPQTMRTALEIPGGVVSEVTKDGGTVTVDEREKVTVDALRRAEPPQYARPTS